MKTDQAHNWIKPLIVEVAVGGGFRSRRCKSADVGFADEKGIATPKGLFDDQFTVGLIVRF